MTRVRKRLVKKRQDKGTKRHRSRKTNWQRMIEKEWEDCARIYLKKINGCGVRRKHLPRPPLARIYRKKINDCVVRRKHPPRPLLARRNLQQPLEVDWMQLLKQDQSRRRIIPRIKRRNRGSVIENGSINREKVKRK